MNYIVAGIGKPTPLDKEEIVNKMFAVARYATRAYVFDDDSEISDFIYSSIYKWKQLNDFSVEIKKIKMNDFGVVQETPSIVDMMIIFADKTTFEFPDFLEQEIFAISQGCKIDKCYLKKWEK